MILQEKKASSEFYDLDEVKRAASGQWESLIPYLTGVSSSFFNGRHGPCPLPGCPDNGGKDRWHILKDFDHSGGCICNQCGAIPNGIEVVRKILGITFPEALQKVAQCVGVEPKEKTKSSTAKEKTDPTKNLKFHNSVPDFFAKSWAMSKPPIVAESLSLVGTKHAIYRNAHSVLALPAIGKEGAPTGWFITHGTGKLLPIYEKGSKEPIDQRTSKCTSGSQAGWIGPTQTDKHEIIWKLEGPTDLLALLSLGIPPNHTACTNLFGSKEDPASNPWMLDRFKGKTVYVLHDSDRPGQDGALEVSSGSNKRPGWAPAIATVAKECRNVVLPYPIAETHGKDLRDWIGERLAEGLPGNEVYQRLLELAARSEVVAGQAIKEKQKKEHQAEADDDPFRLARINLDNYESAHGRKLRWWRGSWYKFRDGRYVEIASTDLSAKVTLSIRNEFERLQKEEFEQWLKGDQDKPAPTIRKVTRQLVSNVVAALESLSIVPSSVEAPCWLPDRSNRNLISTASGLIDVDLLRANDPGCVQPHSPDWFSLTSLPTKFDPHSTSPKWMRYLNTVMEGDLERISILQEIAGYCLIPDCRYQKMFVLEGEGGNGKSVYLAGIRAMLGSQNVSAITIDQLSNRFSLSSTIGKMANLSGDLEELDQLAEGVLKQFTSGDYMTVDRKNRDPISIRPSTKIIACWNVRPRIRDRTNGIWRRMLVVPFRYSIPSNQIIAGMQDADYWDAEASGILNWALVGMCRLLERNRFTQSALCESAAIEYRESCNPAGEFLASYVSESMPNPAHGPNFEPCQLLYQSYRTWCHKCGFHPLSKETFGREVHRKYSVQRDRRPVDGHRMWVYEGIKFDRETFSAEIDDQKKNF